jgi:hypothetical protein
MPGKGALRSTAFRIASAASQQLAKQLAQFGKLCSKSKIPIPAIGNTDTCFSVSLHH